MTVQVCNWCPEPTAPDPRSHPNGQPNHVEQPGDSVNERQEKQMTAMGYAELAEQLTQSVHEIGQSLAEFRKEHGDDWLLIRDERGNPFAAPLLTAKANAIAALAILSKAGEAAT